MTLTINLPRAEQELRERARLESQEPEALAAAVLVSALERQANERAELLRGIQRGLDDIEAGRFRTFSEFAEEQRRKYNLPDPE